MTNNKSIGIWAIWGKWTKCVIILCLFVLLLMFLYPPVLIKTHDWGKHDWKRDYRSIWEIGDALGDTRIDSSQLVLQSLSVLAIGGIMILGKAFIVSTLPKFLRACIPIFCKTIIVVVIVGLFFGISAIGYYQYKKYALHHPSDIESKSDSHNIMDEDEVPQLPEGYVLDSVSSGSQNYSSEDETSDNVRDQIEKEDAYQALSTLQKYVPQNLDQYMDVPSGFVPLSISTDEAKEIGLGEWVFEITHKEFVKLEELYLANDLDGLAKELRPIKKRFFDRRKQSMSKLNLARGYIKSSHKDKAIKVLESVIRDYPNTPAVEKALDILEKNKLN